MIDIIRKIKDIFDGVKNRLVAVGNRKDCLRLRFGIAKASLETGSRMMLNSRKQFLEKGTAYWKKSKGSFYISPKSESNPHIVISGMSGFGKSTLFKSLLLDIRRAGIACIIFDAHNEHSDAVRSLGGNVHNAMYSGINLLELDGASVSERVSELTRLLKEVYSLGYIQATKLSDCLWYTYRKAGARSRSDISLDAAPTIRDLLAELNIFIRNSRGVGETNTLLHLRDRLSLLNSSAFNGGFINMLELGNSLHSFSLANMKSKEVQLIYIGELLNRLYTTMHDSKKQSSIRLYIMIDEAQFLIDNTSNNAVIAKLIEEGRKYGIGVIMVTHAASTLNRKIMANCSVFATFYAREPSEVNYVSRVLSGSSPNMMDAVRSMLGRLEQNQVLLISSCARNPLLVSTPRFDEIKTGGNKESESEVMELLRSRARRPIEHYDLPAVGIVVDEETIDKLVGSGFMDRLAIDTNGKKEDWLMLHNKSISIEHEVWVRKMSELLSSRGVNNSVIDNSNGPDISVNSKGRRIAVEYETGSKSLESTSKMINLRLAEYDNVIIVTKVSSLENYKRRFEANRIIVISVEEVESIIGIITSLA